MRKYDVVFFDAANTLLYPYPSVGEVYAQVASRYGVETTGEAVHATFSKLAVPERFDDFFEELYLLFKQPTVWRLFPECLEVLHTLRQQGYMVGVISNWDIRLLELLQSMGLMTYVQHVSISALVGWEKPHSAIFEHALAAVAVPPARALHIGDNLQADALGAQQAGLQPLWLQRQGATHADYAVIRDLNGVLTWLEAHGT
jgi:putative hydrolase of the HAD superfamily